MPPCPPALPRRTARRCPPPWGRPSANLAALNGGVQPSLEQLRPDMFFGLDDDDDDASSGARGGGQRRARPSPCGSWGLAPALDPALGSLRAEPPEPAIQLLQAQPLLACLLQWRPSRAQRPRGRLRQRHATPPPR